MIRKMLKGDISEAARLHLEFIDNSAFVEFGANFIKAFYEGLVVSPYGINFVYEDKMRVIGFISAVSDQPQFFKEMILNKGPLLFAIGLTQVLVNFRPKALSAFFETFFYPRRTRLDSIKAELLFIALEPAYRRQGIGERLINSVLEELRKNYIYRVKVTTVVKNKIANQLLQKIGFNLERRFDFFSETRNLYSYSIEYA